MSELTIQEAANEAERFGRFVKAFEKLGAVLDSAAQAGRVEQETTRRIEALRVDEAAARARLADVEKAVVLAEQRALAIADQAKIDRETVLSRAAGDAEQIVAAAKEQAANKERAAAELVADAVAKAEAAEAKAKAAEDRAAAADAALGKARAAIAKLKEV